MPTAEGIRRFLIKRGIPVKEVHLDEDGQGFTIVVWRKGNEAFEFLGNTTEERNFTILEIPDSFLVNTWWWLKALVRRWLGKK